MNKKTLASDRRRRKTITLLWVLGVSLLVIFLIYKEMTAILYILATIGVPFSSCWLLFLTWPTLMEVRNRLR